jgi:hypothetical protein
MYKYVSFMLLELGGRVAGEMLFFGLVANVVSFLGALSGPATGAQHQSLFSAPIADFRKRFPDDMPHNILNHHHPAF